jgi:hypothetical protein
VQPQLSGSGSVLNWLHDVASQSTLAPRIPQGRRGTR